MSNLDMRQRESLRLRYAPGPSRVVEHASPWDMLARDTNFMFPSPQIPDGMVGVASISTNGLRTVLQAMRIVSLIVLRENAPSEARSRQSALDWVGEWTFRAGRFGNDRNGPIEVDGYWGWEDPWSPAGARVVLEMMQRAARLRGSWRVLFYASAPSRDSSMWPWPTVHVGPMANW